MNKMNSIRFATINILLLMLSTLDTSAQVDSKATTIIEKEAYTVSNFRTNISFAPIALHGAFNPLLELEPKVYRFVPEYKFSYMGMRFNPNQKLTSSIGADLGFTFLPIGVKGNAESLALGISRVVDYSINKQWKFDTTSSLGYMGVFHQLKLQDDTIRANVSAHGVYYNCGFSLLKRIDERHSTGIVLGVNLYYLWNWKTNIAGLPYGNRAGFGLYPTLGFVYNFSKF